MTLSRIAHRCLVLFLLLLLGVGVYCYHNFPLLLAGQAKHALRDYGLQSLNYEQLTVSHEQLRTNTLVFAGQYQGMAYEGTLTSLEVRYDWRRLFIGKVQSITLGEVELVVTEHEPRANADPSNTRSSSVSLADFLPQAYLAALPMESLTIKQWGLHYGQRDLPPIMANGSLLLNDQLHLTMTSIFQGLDQGQGQLHDASQDKHISVDIWTEGDFAYPRATIRVNSEGVDILKLAALLNAAEPDNWQWSLNGELDYGPLLSWLQQAASKKMLPVDMSTLDGLVLFGNSEFSAEISHLGNVNMSTANRPSLLSQFNAEVNTQTHIRQLDYAGIVSALAGDLDLSMTLSTGEILFKLAPTELQARLSSEILSLPPDVHEWLDWENDVPIRWLSPEAITLKPLAEGGWSFQLHNNLLAIGDKNSELRWQQLQLTTRLAADHFMPLSTEISARLVNRLREKQLPPMNLKFTHQGSLAQSQFNLSLDDVAESISLALQGEGNFESGQGSYHLALSSQDLAYASSTWLPIMQNFGVIAKRQSIEIKTGTMNLDTELVSQSLSVAMLKQRSKLEVTNLTGMYGEYRFEGLNLSADWSGIEQLQTNTPVEFTLAKLNLGFDVTDIHARLSLPTATPMVQPVISIEAFTAGVFGGQVFLSEPRSWDFGAESNEIKLRAKNWRLADIVALQQDQDIHAEGTLEGELPITVTGGRTIIAGGYLRALSPGGSIRYIADEATKALAASSPELGLTMDLLSDFQYEVLSSQVELDKAGVLVLGLSLAGKNPKQEEGRPVNFNINLEQNLDPLLQSLRLSDKLVEQLENRIH